MRIGSIIISHLRKLWKAKFFILCAVIFLARLQAGKFDIDLKGLKPRKFGSEPALLMSIGQERRSDPIERQKSSITSALVWAPSKQCEGSVRNHELEQNTYITTVVDEARQIAERGGVDDGLVVNPEHVAAADPAVLVAALPQVSHRLADHLAHVLDHHLVRGDRLLCEQAPVVNRRLGELQLLLAHLWTWGGDSEQRIEEKKKTPILHYMKSIKQTNKQENSTHHPAMNIALCAFRWRIRHIFRNERAGKFRPIRDLVRIGSKIFSRLSKLWKAKFFTLYDVIFLVRLQRKFEIDHTWEWKGKPFRSWAQKVHSPNLLKRKCISEIARICSIIIFHLSKL